jgi:hypothetical protein
MMLLLCDHLEGLSFPFPFWFDVEWSLFVLFVCTLNNILRVFNLP